MFDTMTITKASAGLLGAWLVFLLIGWGGETIYGGGHGGGHEEQAYVIDTGASEGGTGGETETVDVAAILAAGDAAAGEGAFRACQSCHKLDGTNATGPHLDGIVGRQIAGVADFDYSDAMKEHSGDSWTPENLYLFLQNPKAYVPGTKMTYAGMRKDTDRANLIAYLATQTN